MRFRRYIDPERKGITPRRLAHARKAVQRDKDSWGLFPEYVKHNTAEERLEALDSGLEQHDRERRVTRAKEWRLARVYLNTVPEPLRTRVLRNWNSRHWTPAEPYCLQSLVRDALTGRFDPEKQEREIERCRLLGRYVREIADTVPLPEGLSPLDQTLFRLREAKKRIMEFAPHLYPADGSA